MSMFPTRRVDGSSPTAAGRSTPVGTASLPRPSQGKDKDAMTWAQQMAGLCDLTETQERNLDALAVEFAWGCGWPSSPLDGAVRVRLHNRPHLVAELNARIDPGSGPGTPEEAK